MRTPALIILLFSFANPTGVACAQEEPLAIEVITTVEEAIEADTDGSLDDADNSIRLREIVKEVTLTADFRGAHSGTRIDSRDGETLTDDVLESRARMRADVGISTSVRGTARIAGRCSNFNCNLDFTIDDSITTANSMSDGEVTIDEAFLQWYQLDQFDVALGRLQTKFVARGGVYAKSLDRNDSHNMTINWTDGLHATLRVPQGWDGHLILQHNATDGASNVRRDPLNFADDDAKITYLPRSRTWSAHPTSCNVLSISPTYRIRC